MTFSNHEVVSNPSAGRRFPLSYSFNVSHNPVLKWAHKRKRATSWGLLLLFLIPGCNEYQAVNEVGYPSAAYVTAVYEDGTEQDVMLEDLKELSTTNLKGLKGLDRQTRESILMSLDDAIKAHPNGRYILERHKGTNSHQLEK